MRTVRLQRQQKMGTNLCMFTQSFFWSQDSSMSALSLKQTRSSNRELTTSLEPTFHAMTRLARGQSSHRYCIGLACPTTGDA